MISTNFLKAHTIIIHSANALNIFNQHLDCKHNNFDSPRITILSTVWQTFLFVYI